MFPTLSLNVVLAGILALVMTGMGWRIHSQYQEITELHASLGAAQANTDELQRSLDQTQFVINRQNEEVRKLKREGEARENLASILIQKANARAKEQEKFAQDLLARAPKTQDLCFEANALLNEYLQRRVKENEKLNPAPPPVADPKLKLSSGLFNNASSSNRKN